jgi:hypothetical protein
MFQTIKWKGDGGKKEWGAHKATTFFVSEKKVGWLMNFTLLTPCLVIQIVQLKPKECTLV